MGHSEIPLTQIQQAVALIIEPEWIIPIEPADVVLTGHSIVIDNGIILDLLPAEEATRRYKAAQIELLPGQVVLPGLVNLHCHAAMTLLRGYADDLPLRQWLETRIWPAEAALAGPEFVRTGSLLACLEMLRGGITCFNDMYFFAEETAEAALATGIRASLGMVVIDFPTAYADSLDGYLSKGRAMQAKYRGAETLSFCWAPHAPYTVGDSAFEQIACLAVDMETPIHIHLHETELEIEGEIGRYGVRPITRLNRLGVLGPKTIGVHAVHLGERDVDVLAATGTHLAHCPTSNMKLGSGIADLPKWLIRDINFGLGTDGAASNNTLDLWREMRQASLLAKGSSRDASMLGSHKTLYAATLGGARALGLDHKIGSIIPGKSADLISVSLDNWIQQPLYDPASHLIHVTDRTHVSTVWVNGHCVVKKHIPLFDAWEELMKRVKEWQNNAQKL